MSVVGCVVRLSTMSCFTLPYRSHISTSSLNSNSRLSGLFLVSGSVSTVLIVAQSMQKPVLVGVFSIFF